MIAVVLGTKPRFIKMPPIVQECEARNLVYFVHHSGQHQSYEMNRAFFGGLKPPEPKYNLNVGSGTRAGQTAKIMARIEDVLINEFFRHGPRSGRHEHRHGRGSRGHGAPHPGRPRQDRPPELRQDDARRDQPGGHRPRLQLRKMVEQFRVPLDETSIVSPVGFLEFLQLESNVYLALTDSGGIKEETCTLGVPYVTFQENTEQSETIEVRERSGRGEAEGILASARQMLSRPRSGENPYEDGTARKMSVTICNGLPSRNNCH